MRNYCSYETFFIELLYIIGNRYVFSLFLFSSSLSGAEMN